MQEFLTNFLSILCLSMATLGYSQTLFSVTSYGAVGDGTTDNSQVNKFPNSPSKLYIFIC